MSCQGLKVEGRGLTAKGQEEISASGGPVL